MKRRFLLTPEARNDLRDILLDIAEDSPITARLASTSAMARRDDTAARRDLQTTAHQEHLPRKFAA